jgi:hypothetical protein
MLSQSCYFDCYFSVQTHLHTAPACLLHQVLDLVRADVDLLQVLARKDDLKGCEQLWQQLCDRCGSRLLQNESSSRPLQAVSRKQLNSKL